MVINIPAVIPEGGERVLPAPSQCESHLQKKDNTHKYTGCVYIIHHLWHAYEGKIWGRTHRNEICSAHMSNICFYGEPGETTYPHQFNIAMLIFDSGDSACLMAAGMMHGVTRRFSAAHFEGDKRVIADVEASKIYRIID